MVLLRFLVSDLGLTIAICQFFCLVAIIIMESEITHDVFVWCDPTSQVTFADYLCKSLDYSGFSSVRNDAIDDRVEVGRYISESEMAAVVFSETFWYDTKYLDEFVVIMDKQECDSGYNVLPIFYGVEPEDVFNQEGVFKVAFDGFEKDGEHSKDKIDEWKKALSRVSELAGGDSVLQHEPNGHEAGFIQSIVKEIENILKRKAQSVPSYTVGLESRAKEFNMWYERPESANSTTIGIMGFGKTTFAKVVYNLRFAEFEASSFLMNIRVATEERDGLIHLRSQLLSDISKRKMENIRDINDGIVKIQDAICGKRVLIVLDDVDKIEQVEALIGAGDLFLKGSKIIITTSNERLLVNRKHIIFNIKPLDYNESLQLFSLHAFLQDRPAEGYLELSERIVQYCEGLPLALQVMGSSLFGKNLEFWASALEKLEAISDERIRKTLEVSYKSLYDQDKQLFLTIATSFVGEDMDFAVEMLELNYCYSKVRMRNLMDRSLIMVDKYNRIIIPRLVRDMARAIIHEETFDSVSCFASTGAQSETTTTEQSLLSSKNFKCGKRKHVEDYEDESMSPTNEERSSFSFKRLCVGLFSLFNQPTRFTKLLTAQHS